MHLGSRPKGSGGGGNTRNHGVSGGFQGVPQPSEVCKQVLRELGKVPSEFSTEYGLFVSMNFKCSLPKGN